MTIVEALKTGKLYSIENQSIQPSRWMYFDAPNFVVLKSRRGGSLILTATPNESEAVKWLLGEETQADDDPDAASVKARWSG